MHNIVIFGASITQGAFDGVGGGWANRLAAHCFKKDSQTLVFNLGISGDTSAGIRNRFEVELAPRVQDAAKVTIIISVGGNDALVDIASGKHWVELSDYLANMEYFIRFAKGKGYSVACVGLGTVDDSKLNPLPWDTSVALTMTDIVKYDEALKMLADTEEVPYIPMRDLFAERLDLLADAEHPNAEGHELMFERVKEHLEKAGII